MKNAIFHTFRLKPGQDLFASIEAFVAEQDIQAGIVLSSVGSLTNATLRLANRDFHTSYEGFFEIVSLTGTVSTHGSHLHISISDGDGQTQGGHLVEGSLIYTTAEIVVAEFPQVIYERALCELSGYDELVVQDKVQGRESERLFKGLVRLHNFISKLAARSSFLSQHGVHISNQHGNAHQDNQYPEIGGVDFEEGF